MDWVEERNGGLYVARSRVSLDSVVYAYLRGESPLGICESFTSLSLDQVNGAIEYYLANRKAVDEYLEQQDAEFDRMAEESRRQHPEFYARVEAIRRERLNRRKPAQI